MNRRSCVGNGRFYQNMIKINDIYVSINASLFDYIYISIYIRWGRKHIQHSMLSHPAHNNISINNYYQERLQTFMLSEWLFITRSLNILYLEVITNFPCQICTINSLFYYRRNDKECFQQICYNI